MKSQAIDEIGSRRVESIAGPAKGLAEFRRILVKEVNWLGDLVMSLPALRALRVAYPDAWLSVLIREELWGFFDGITWIEEVIPYRIRSGLQGLADQRDVIRGISQRNFDVAVSFPNSFVSALWLALARIPERAGYALDGRSLLLTRRSSPRPDALQGHQNQYWLALLRDTLGVGPVASTESLQLEVSSNAAARMRRWLDTNRKLSSGPLIALAAGAAYGPAKEWSEDHFVRLIDELARCFGAEGVLLGAPGEKSKCERIATAAKASVLIAAGSTDVAELKALLSLCSGFAGNDSGAMHVAAALGIPAVGIFGSTNPYRTGPIGPKASVIYHGIECSPCLERTCRYDHYLCLRGIEPGEVIAALEKSGAFSPTSTL